MITFFRFTGLPETQTMVYFSLEATRLARVRSSFRRGLRESWAGCRGAISHPAGLLVLSWGLVPLSAQRSMIVFCLLCLYHLSVGGEFFCFNEILMKSHSVLTLSEYFYFIRVLTDKYYFMKLVSVLYVRMRKRVCVTEGGRWEI